MFRLMVKNSMRFLRVLLFAFVIVPNTLLPAEQNLFAGERFVGESIHDNVRVVLMSVGFVTVFPQLSDFEDPQFSHLKKDGIVQCVAFTMLVEHLGNQPTGRIVVKDIELVVRQGDAKPSINRSGNYYQLFDYDVFQPFLEFSKPKVSSSDRAAILRYVEFVDVKSPRKAELSLKAGFGEYTRDFKFDKLLLQ